MENGRDGARSLILALGANNDPLVATIREVQKQVLEERDRSGRAEAV